MGAVVADTHTMVWYVVEPPLLSRAADQALREAVDGGDHVYISAISLIEAVYLVEKGRLPEDVWARLSSFLAQPDADLTVVDVSAEIAHTLKTVSRDLIPDMPDRIIAATAVHLSLPLITRDRRIRSSGVTTVW